MTDNRTAARESMLLSVIIQALARGAQDADVQQYIQQLELPSSLKLVDEIKASIRGERKATSSVERWAHSLIPAA